MQAKNENNKDIRIIKCAVKGRPFKFGMLFISCYKHMLPVLLSAFCHDYMLSIYVSFVLFLRLYGVFAG